MSAKPEPAICSRNTSQWIPCFKRSQLTITSKMFALILHAFVDLLAGIRPPCSNTKDQTAFYYISKHHKAI